MREAQTLQSSALSERLLEAFATHFRQNVERLVEKLGEMGERISKERKAMEDSFRGLTEALAEAAREGGEDLSRQMEKASAGADARQAVMLENLTKFTTDMQVDIDLLQDRVRQAGREVSGQVAAQTRDMLENNEKNTRELAQHMDEVVNTVGREQAIFIEMMGERLETLRKRLKVK